MSSGIEKAKGYTNALVGMAKELAGAVLGKAKLYQTGRSQVEKGKAQIIWGEEEHERERTQANARDPMIKKLMGRQD
jgi:uncharacterized protein YjbJ (UPF0337 family)